MNESLPKEEWLRRYIARMMARSGMSEDHARANAESFWESVFDWDDSPEEAADEDMNCWEDDGDE